MAHFELIPAEDNSNIYELFVVDKNRNINRYIDYAVVEGHPYGFESEIKLENAIAKTFLMRFLSTKCEMSFTKDGEIEYREYYDGNTLRFIFTNRGEIGGWYMEFRPTLSTGETIKAWSISVERNLEEIIILIGNLWNRQEEV